MQILINIKKLLISISAYPHFKKKILVSGFVFASLLTSFSTPCLADEEQLPKSITVGINPGGNPENVKKQGLKFAEILQNELNIPVNIFLPKDYEGLIEAMKTKKVDFGFFSSLSFVYAEERANAKVLLKKVWASPFYYSAIIVPHASKIQSVADLKGKKVAFVDENSTSGYLYPLVMLQKKGIDTKDFKFTKFSRNHSASVALLEKSEVDAIAVFSDDKMATSGAWTKFATKKNQKYRAIWVSEPIPNDPFCVRQDFYNQFPKFTHSLMFAILDIFDKNKNSLGELLGSQDLMLATSRQYDPVREMVKTLNLGIK